MADEVHARARCLFLGKVSAIVIVVVTATLVAAWAGGAFRDTTTRQIHYAGALPALSMCGETPVMTPTSLQTCEQPCGDSYEQVKWTRWSPTSATGFAAYRMPHIAGSSCNILSVSQPGRFKISLTNVEKVSYCNLDGSGVRTVSVYTRATIAGVPNQLPVPVVGECIHVP